MYNNRLALAEGVLYDKPFWIHSFDIDEVVEIRKKILTFKSTMGFLINRTYDDTIKLLGRSVSYDEFLEFVIEELHEDYHIFMFQLYLHLPIENELNDYVINNLDFIIGGE